MPFALNAAAAVGMGFPPQPRVDSMLLQSQYAHQPSQQQHFQQQQHNSQQYQQMLASMGSGGIPGVASLDFSGGIQGGFSLGYTNLMQAGSGVFNVQNDATLQAHQLLQQNVAMMNGTMSQNGSLPVKSQRSVSAGSTGTSEQHHGLQPGAQPFTLSSNHIRRNSSSFQHLGMIEGVLDGDELAGIRDQ